MPPRTRSKTVEKESAPAKSELATMLANVNKTHGTHVVRVANVVPNHTTCEFGVFTMDFALMGGFPEGVPMLLYGHESSGKSTIALRMVASKQRKFTSKMVVWVDAEGMFDKVWAEHHGVDLSRCLVVSPDSGEQAVDLVVGFAQTMEVCMVVVDSIPALVPAAIQERSAEDSTMAALARLVGNLCSRLCSALSVEKAKRQHFVDIVLINQFRASLATYGSPNMLPGGRQQHYFAMTKLWMKNKPEEGLDAFGNHVTVANQHSFKIEKKKTCSINAGEFRIVVDENDPLGMGAVDDAPTLAAFAKKMGFLVGRPKAWKLHGVSQTFAGNDAVVEFLRENHEAYLDLSRKIIAMHRCVKNMPPIPPDGYLLGWLDDAAIRRMDYSDVLEAYRASVESGEGADDDESEDS